MRLMVAVFGLMITVAAYVGAAPGAPANGVPGGSAQSREFNEFLSVLAPDGVLPAPARGAVTPGAGNGNVRDQLGFLQDTARRLTDDPRDEYAASMIQLSNGDLLVAYDLWLQHNSDSGYKVIRRSTDGGNSWPKQDSIRVTGGYRAWPRLGQCSDSTVLMFYRYISSSTPRYYQIFYRRSTDNGYHWSTERTLPTDTGPKFGGDPFVPSPGNLWVFYTLRRSATGYDVYMDRSTNSGLSWQGRTPLIEAPGDQYFGSIVRAPDSRLWLFYRQSATGDTGIYCVTSSDTGRTWSVPRRLLGVSGTPFCVVDRTGRFWLTFTLLHGHYNYEAYYVTSSDNGMTWSDTSRFTRFVGGDIVSWLGLANGQPLVFFHSVRTDNGDIYYGRPDSIADPNPPPYLPDYDTLSPTSWNPHATPPVPRLGQVFSVVALCLDEEGISAVKLVYDVNGAPQPELPLYDDGQHGDYAAGDGRYGNFLGPFVEHAATLTCRVKVRDVSGNEILGHHEPLIIDVTAVHDTGTLALFIDPHTGSDGTEQAGVSPSCEWPKGSGNNHLFRGHAWAGVVVPGETLWSGYNPNSGQCDWTVCAGETLRWYAGWSDWDSYVEADDREQTSGSPIGIEIHKHSLSWHHWRIDDFIIQEYVFKNTGLHGNLDSVYLGFCYDFDVVNWDYADDLVESDDWRRLSYMYDADANPGSRIGVRMLSHSPRNHLWWSINSDPESDAERYRMLASNQFMPRPDSARDYRVLQSVGPFNLRSGDSVKVVVGLVAGGNLQELQQNADEMDSLYRHGYVPGVEETEPRAGGYAFALEPVTPSVAKGRAVIEYQIPAEGHVSLAVYDLSGSLVRSLVDAPMPLGRHSVRWDGTDNRGLRVAEGVYFVRLAADQFRAEQKLVLMK